MKNEYLEKAKSINASLVVTFKTPKVAVRLSDEPTRLSTKDTDFFEQEVLRQFFINMSRVVEFQFVAYPEDRAYDSDKTFVPLHYHAAVRSKNDAKFKAIAERKYTAALKTAYEKEFPRVVVPISSIFVETMNRDDPEKSYEEYILKHYDPSKRLVTHDDFMTKKPLAA